MLFSWTKNNVAVGFVVGERWLTSAWLIGYKSRRNRKGNSILADRQSTKVVMLCQRPIYTHNHMSLAELISSNLNQVILKTTPIPLIKKPFVSLQLPERLYETLIVEKPNTLKLTGQWAAAALADAGYNLNEWRWDVCLQGSACVFLLVKMVDLHHYLQPLNKAGCVPNAVSYINPERLVSLDNHLAPQYTGMTVLPDPIAAKQAVCLAATGLGYIYA